MSIEHSYIFRVPVSSSIRRRTTPDDTFSALCDINNSRPSDKRLPVEILLLINDHAQTNPTHEKVRSTWTSVTHQLDFFGSIPRESILLDKYKRSYYCSTVQYSWQLTACERAQVSVGLYGSVSSADLLYRLRCFFPEVHVKSQGPEGYKSVWAAGVRHIQSGVILLFTEHKGGVSVYVVLGRRAIDMKEAGAAFTNDTVELLNTFFETVDGTRRFAFFHPAAEACFPAAKEHYLAVPAICFQHRVGDLDGSTEDLKPYIPWLPLVITAADDSSLNSYSLLPDLTYNVESRKVDTVNGTADLTTIISSSLLFYRLLCHFVCDDNNANHTAPITSVWQVKLQHKVNKSFILFMDDHGLFDIRGGEDTKEVMDDIKSLVNALCCDECCHPYDLVVAGCAA